MSDLSHILKRLPVEAHGFGVVPHTTYENEWWAGFDGCGDIGPFVSPADALVGGIRWLVNLYRTNRDLLAQVEHKLDELHASQRRTFEAVNTADLIVFCACCQENTTPGDRELCQFVICPFHATEGTNDA